MESHVGQHDYPSWRQSGGVKVTLSDGGITIEEYRSDLKDFKFFCFAGKVRFFKVDFGRFIEHHANYYDRNGKLLPFGEADFPPKPEQELCLPENLAQMMAYAERLSADIPFLRVDFYNIRGRIYFGEITFFPAAGNGLFTPIDWNEKIGEWLLLPQMQQ